MKTIMLLWSVLALSLGIPNDVARTAEEGTCHCTFVVPEEATPPLSCPDTCSWQTDFADLYKTVLAQQVQITTCMEAQANLTSERLNLALELEREKSRAAGLETQVLNLTYIVYSLENHLTQMQASMVTSQSFADEDHRLGSQLNPASSCLHIKQTNPSSQDGAYFLIGKDGTIYQTYCDMTTAGGGWTLVSSVHEDDMYGKCTAGDRWSSTRGNNINYPGGDGNWANVHTFGSMGSATTDDYKNPGYFSIDAANVMLWHVPNNVPPEGYKTAAYLRYRTSNGFLEQYGGNLYSLFKDHYPIGYGLGTYTHDNGPAIPIVYEQGSNHLVLSLLPPNIVSRNEAIPGYVHFRVFANTGSCTAVCPGVNFVGANAEHACIGGGGYWPDPLQCGDYARKDGNGYGTGVEWSSNQLVTESVIMFFYR